MTDAITAYVHQLLEIMGFEIVNITCKPLAEPDQYWLSVQVAQDSRLLIGSYGAHLEALQHLVRMRLRKLAATIHVTVDVNDYRAQREEKLRLKAQEAAEQVHRTGQTLVLQPMGPADRRIIHATLADRTDIRTESMGAEPRRRVVVKPVAF